MCRLLAATSWPGVISKTPSGPVASALHYLRVLAVLGLEGDVDALPADD
jgi:hypothetical protein